MNLHKNKENIYTIKIVKVEKILETNKRAARLLELRDSLVIF